MKTIVVNCNKDDYDVYIGRPSLFGNPFIIGKDGTRNEVIEKYHKWIIQQPLVMQEIKKLKGKRLGCYCAPLKCHGDILAELANNLLDEEFS